MSKIIHEIYKDYPEQPYISSSRDLKAWEETPEEFPYGIIERKNMIRLEDNILPGHIIMLWRINFDNFTNETVIPQYFEYRYGVNSDEVLKDLVDLKYIELNSAKESLGELNMIVLKRILKNSNLPTSGKKADLLFRIENSFSNEELEKLFPLRKYSITNNGKEILNKYESIIKKHGIKK